MNIRSCDSLSTKFLSDFPVLWEKTENIDLTSVLLDYWANLGYKNGYVIFTQQKFFSDSEGEYLVDLCWSYEDEDQYDYWIELALESEVSDDSLDGMKYDFYKIVDVKAYTKVGIFYPLLKDKDEFLNSLSKIVAFHGIKNPLENYLIILLVDHGAKEDPKKRVEVSTYKMDYNGKLTKLKEIRVDA